MGLFDEVVDYTKKYFVPKGVGVSDLLETPFVQDLNAMTALSAPGVPLGMAALAKMAESVNKSGALDVRVPIPFSDKYTTPRKEGRNLMDALDATGPGAGIDDLAIAGAKSGMAATQKLMRAAEASPYAFAGIAPMFRNLGIVKPRGAAYIPGKHHFESKLAEALDERFIAPGNPSDTVSLKEIQATLGKLPGAGIKKEELAHFNLKQQIDSMLAAGKARISREELAGLIDAKMPRIEVATDSRRHAEHTLGGVEELIDEEGKSSFRRPPDYKSYIMYAPRVSHPKKANIAYDTRNSKLLKAQSDYEAGKISSDDYANQVKRITDEADKALTDPLITGVEPFRDVGRTTSVGHYDQDKYPNILGWARTTRRPFGSPENPETAKYIEEIQSDWASSADKNNPFPLHDANALLMRYIDRISRQAGEEAVGWTPPVVQIGRWGGSKRTYQDPQRLESFRNVPDFLASFGKTKLEPRAKRTPGTEQAALEVGDMIKSLPEFQRYVDFYARRGVAPDPNTVWRIHEPGRYYDEFTPSIEEMKAHRNLENAIGKKLEQSPIFATVNDVRNYTGFEDVYGKKMPKTASQILKKRGEGAEVFNDRTVGDLEGAVSREYNRYHKLERGYAQPEDTGSFFYRILKGQRGKPVPYPDSLWGLLGATGLASMLPKGEPSQN